MGKESDWFQMAWVEIVKCISKEKEPEEYIIPVFFFGLVWKMSYDSHNFCFGLVSLSSNRQARVKE